MDGFPNLASNKKQERKTSDIQFRVVNPVDLTGRPVPPREWIVEDWLPIGCVTADYGDGGRGKTLLAQQLMTSTALPDGLWCGRQVMSCKSLGYFCEDDEDELHRRQAAICAAYGVSIADLGAMRWVSGVGQDNDLMKFDFEGAFTTPLYDKIKNATMAHDARLIVLDTAADVFGGNENDRHQVRRFIGQLNQLAIDIKGAVLLNAHPSRDELKTGNLDGGSTAWNNSVRSRWSLARPAAEEGAEPDVDARILTRRKANYAAIGEDIRLQWRAGVLVPQHVAAGGGAPARAAAAELFLILLDRCMEQNQSVSQSSHAGNYAPKVFGGRPDRGGYTRKEFEAAMSVLFATKRIRVAEYGRPGHLRNRIEREPSPAGLEC